MRLLAPLATMPQAEERPTEMPVAFNEGLLVQVFCDDQPDELVSWQFELVSRLALHW